MEPIEITKEQQTKLLEMCKALFPEYNTHETTGYGGWSLDSNGNQHILVGYLRDDFNDRANDPDVYIHWFEFCNTHLAGKLALIREESKLDIIKASEYYRTHHNINLINFLYEEFLKLKL